MDFKVQMVVFLSLILFSYLLCFGCFTLSLNFPEGNRCMDQPRKTRLSSPPTKFAGGPIGSFEAYKYIEDILKVTAQVSDNGPCATYIDKRGSGNFVKMVHNGIEYGDIQLIAKAYDVLKSIVETFIGLREVLPP
uniref:phosphogluconate dehydrogenase (NADP(+)-dependent, decarboxylating) n=1 Tax=Vitis vinifera TaxID=29760 RepID=F6I2T1_VITVI